MPTPNRSTPPASRATLTPNGSATVSFSVTLSSFGPFFAVSLSFVYVTLFWTRPTTPRSASRTPKIAIIFMASDLPSYWNV